MSREKLTNQRIEKALEVARGFGEEGLQLVVYKGSEKVIDTWTGLAVRETEEPVTGDTIFPVFSVSKAATATAVHVQAARGLIDYEAPLAEYWPEFGQNGKDKITVRHVLTHRAGLPQMPDGMTSERFADWDWMVRKIEKLSPLWEPGSRNSYLAFTFGWLLGELVARTDPKKRGFVGFLQEEIFEPLKIDSFWIGLPDDQRPRLAKLYTDGFPRPPIGKAPFNSAAIPPQIAPSPQVFNDPVIQKGCIPAANGIANARSVARLFAMIANGGILDGVRLLPDDLVRSFTILRDDPYQPDEVIGRPPLVGMGGYFVAGEYPPGEPVIGNNPHVLAQPGGGQTIAWADLDSGFAASICHNRMFSNLPPRPVREHPFTEIGEAVRDCMGDYLATIS